MPVIGNNLSYGGRHHSIFRDSLVQRSLIIKGTAAIRKVIATNIEADTITLPTENNMIINDGVTLRDYALRIQSNLGINMLSCDTTNYSTDWSLQVGGITTAQLMLNINSSQVKMPLQPSQVSTIQTNNVAYVPPKIQTAYVGANSAWLANLPANIYVIHILPDTGKLYVILPYDMAINEVEVDWRLPLEYFEGDDVWVGISWPIPTDHRILAYNYKTKGVCILLRTAEVLPIKTLSFFDLDRMDSHITNVSRSAIEAYSHTDVNFARVYLRDIDMPFSPPINGQTTALELMRNDNTAYAPLVCSDVFLVNATNSVGTTLTSQLDQKHPLTPVDTAPTAASTSLVQSGGLHSYLQSNYIPLGQTDMFTMTKVGTGNYRIDFAVQQSNNYVIILTSESIITGGTHSGTQGIDDYMLAYHSKSSTGFNVYVKEQDDSSNDGVFRDVKFDFVCVSRGFPFAHGEVNGFTSTILR